MNLDPDGVSLREALLRLLDVDSYPKTAELIRADMRVLTDEARVVLDELMEEACRRAIPSPPESVAQISSFLARCSTATLAAVFPPGSDTIDPQIVAVIQADLSEAAAADAAYQRDGDVASLDQADWAWRQVLVAPALDGAHPSLKAGLLNDAAGSAIRRFWHTGDPPDFARARELYEAALALTPAMSVRRIGRLGNLAMVRREAHLRYGDAEAIERAEALLREAIALVERARGALPVAADALTNLALVLRDRYLQSGDPGVLREAITFGERACEASDAVGPRIMLGDLLSENFPHSGAVSDLVRAVDLLSDALDRVSVSSPQRPRTMVDLAVALTGRHTVLGNPTDLDRAVDLLAQARNLFPETAPDLPSAHVQLAVALYRRFESAGRLDDLDRSAELLEDVIRTASSDEVAAPTWRTNLATVLVQRSRRTGSPADLDRAIEIYTGIAASGATTSNRYAVLNNLGNALRDRSRRSPDEVDLDRAVVFLREAIELGTAASGRLATTLSNLGVALRDRFVLTRRTEDLDEALDVTERAVGIGSGDDADSARRFFAHALAAQEAADLGSEACRDDAVAAYRQGCEVGLVADLESTLIAAQDWGRWAATRGEWSSAAEAYGIAVDAAGMLVGTQVVRDHQETWLRAAQNLSGRAALAMATAGRPTDAVIAVERSRAALLSEALGRDRADLIRLGTERTDLRDRYEGAVGALAGARAHGATDGRRRRDALLLADALDTDVSGQSPVQPMLGRSAVGQTSAVAGGGVDAVRAARAELDSVIDEIRTVGGFEQFLAPPTFDDVAAVAQGCPLVYFAAADQGGLALIVRGEDVTHVDLNSLTAEALRSRVEAHLREYAEFRGDPDGRRRLWHEALESVTAWLWDHAVGAVMEKLTADTHAVFVAGGLLGLLPLHAAWTLASHPEDPDARRYALDELAISYSPNARALRASRELAARTEPSRLLAVVDPSPVATSDLPYAGPEAAGVIAATGLDHHELRGAGATPFAFRSEATGSDVLLLVCHGRAELAEPLRSGLLLAGRPVDLEELMAMKLEVRLAILSACETALPGTELPDEVIGLPTGLLQAGVAGVIASLWAVPDRATAMLMTEFARRWRANRSDPAEALRQAQCWMRDTTNREKVLHWRRARTEEPTLPDDVVNAFIEPLAGLDRDARDHATPAAWAAFTHLGA